MESSGCKDGPGNNVVVNSKLRSPSKANDSHTMDSFQDGGQQNMNSEQNDFPPPLDGPHMNSDMNNYPTGPGDQGMPPDGFGRLNEGMHPGQMQGYSYNRGNYNMGDQHGGLNMAGSPDFTAQGPQYHGQYPQAGMRSGYPTGPKPGMGHIRPGMGSPSMGMVPPGYNSGNPRLMSGQSIAQQGGPTPTLNQLLQTPNSTQRFQNSYNDYGGVAQKPGGDMVGGDPPYSVQQGWGSQRQMNPYSQGPNPMSGNVPYRNQSGSMGGDMNQQRRQPGMPPSYPSQGGQYGGSGQQFSPNSPHPQRYGMMPSHSGRMMPTGPMGQMSQPYNQQMPGQYGQQQGGAQGYSTNQPTPQQPAPPLQHSPAPQSVSSSSTSQPGGAAGPYLSPPHSGATPGASSVGSGSPSSQPSPQQRITPPIVKPHALKPHHSSFVQHNPIHQHQSPQNMTEPQQSPEGFSNNRQIPSKQTSQENDVEVNSTFEENSDGGRLSTPPNSSSGPQHPVVSNLRPVPSPAGSTGSRSNTPASLTGNQAGSPMPTRPSSRQLDGQNRMNNQSPMPTSYNQQMMPPPMGPNQMGYGAGNKMGPSGPQMGSQMGHFPQYNSQFHQGNYSRHAGPGPGPGSGMQGYGGPHQNSFNGPNQMPANSMYGNMNRNMPNMGNMPNAGYPGSFNQANNMQMGMSNQYGNYNATNSNTGPPGANPSMALNSGMGPPVNSAIPNMSSPGGHSTGTGSAAKGAQAAAQAAMLAAANSAVNRPQPAIRPSGPGAGHMTNHQRMYPSQGMNQMGQMNSMGGNGPGYPGMNQMSNSQPPINQMPNSMSQSPVPSSMNQIPNSSMSEPGGMSNSSGMGMMSSATNMPNSTMPHMSMPNTSTPHSGMPNVSSMPSHSSHMPHVGMPHSGFPTNSNNPLSNMASMSEGIMSSNPPGSGIPNSNMANASLQSSNINSLSSDSGISSSSSTKMGSSSSSGSGPTPPLTTEGKPTSSATPPSSAGQTLDASRPVPVRSPPSSKTGPPTPQAASLPATSVPSTSAPLNCTGPSEDEVKPPTTTTNTNTATTSTVVTQSITSPVASIAENSNSSSIDAQSESMINMPVICTPAIIEDTPDKKKKESVGIAPSPGTASVSSYHEEFDNISSPSWPGTPKSGTPDLSKLFEMGEEPNRRPFLEKLFQYLEEKGTPVTTMPSISKQPLDLYKLYLQVRDKGGMTEVTKTKKWKEICGVVNIGASASAAFTLKKNYIKYLFSYECKFDKGGIDPAPILAQMEAALQQKRDSKNKCRAPSPAGSQGSQDAFRPPSTPNSQGMEQFHPGMQQPGGYMGNDVGMGPMGNNMMPPGNMMNSMGGPVPNMPPPGPMGPMQPHSMPHQSMGPGGNMQGGMMPGNIPPGAMPPGAMPPGAMPPGAMPPGSMPPGAMPQNNMIPHNNYNMPQNNMMGPGTNGMPPPQVNNNMMPSTNDSISVQDPFADEPNSNPQYPRFGPSNQMPFNAGMQPPTSMNNSFNQYGNRPAMGGSNVPVPPYNSSGPPPPPHNSNFNDTMNLPASQGEQFNDTYRRPPGPTEGFSSSQSGGDPYTGGNSGQFSGNRMPQNSQPGGPFPPFSGQQQFERFEQPSHMAPPGNQAFRPPSHAQPGMGGLPTPQPHGPPDQAFPVRFANQQTSPRPPMSQANQFNQPSMFPNQGSGFSTPSKTMGGSDQYQRYPTPPPPSHQQQPPPPPSTLQTQASPFPNQRPVHATPPKRYPDMDRRDYNVPTAYCPQPSMYGEKNQMASGYGPHRQSMLPPPHENVGPMADSRRDMNQWSPMPRYPPQHPGSAYPGSPVPPGHHPNMGMPYNRFNPRSPHRDKFMSPQKMQKPGMMSNAHFMARKEIIFPPDSVEAVQPLLAKRKKLNTKDLGPVEAWRLMMALKSGMLAESTWALDTLSVMLYDDNTVGYFGLIHLPGLLEVLIEHFRQCLIQIFGRFDELEIGYDCKKPPSPCKKLRVGSDSEGDEVSDMDTSFEEADPDSRLIIPDLKEENDSFKWDNFTYVTRQGKSVKIEENSKDANIMADKKLWDTFVGFNSGKSHWKVGRGETTRHIATHFESDENLSVLKKLFSKYLTKNQISKENGNLENVVASEKTVETTKDNDNTDNDSVDTTVLETETDSTVANNDTVNPDKNNCVCDNVHIKNDLKMTIKSEPIDPEENKMEDEKAEPCKEKNETNSEKYDAKTPSGEKVATDSNESSKSNESDNVSVEKTEVTDSESTKVNSETPENGPAEVTENDLRSKPHLACFFNNENTKDLLRGVKRPLSADLEEEAFQRDEPALCLMSCSREEVSRRCICVSNIIRSLSFIPGNDIEISKHAGLLYIFGKLLLLHHTHNQRAKNRPKLDHEESVVPEDLVDLTHGIDSWWWDCLNALRENTLVTLANLSGKLNLSKFPEEICLPILDGLLHWAVCPSACAQDPLLTMPSTSVLSPKRLVLETMCKLSIQEANVDLMLATPPFSRIVQLFSNLCKLLANKKQQVTQEFAIVLLAALVQGHSSAARAIAMQHPCISLLIDFLETAEQNALQVANTHGVQMLRDNPETMGTSLDMLRRAASTLVHMAKVPENRTLFVHHQSRLLTLVMSQILDQHVAQILAEVLYECSQSS